MDYVEIIFKSSTIVISILRIILGGLFFELPAIAYYGYQIIPKLYEISSTFVNWIIKTIILNDQLIQLLWPIIFALPSQILSLFSVMPVLIALLEVPFLPAIMIYLPKSTILIMVLTFVIGSISAANIYANYKYFEVNGVTKYVQLAELVA